MPAQKATRRFVTLDIAAEYLSVDKRTVRNFIAQGRLAGYRTGPRLIRVDLNEIDAMLRPIPNAKSA